MPPVQQYLNRYAEEECRWLPSLHLKPYDHVLVIPCFAETSDFAERLQQGLLRHHNALTIVIINQPAHGESAPHPANLELLRYFSHLPIIGQQGNLQLHTADTGRSHWLVVDRFQDQQLPHKEGVGLARKVGCDMAAWIHRQGLLRSSWIHCTDADAHLPANYFDLPSKPYSAAIYAFRHQLAAPDSLDDQQVHKATVLYDTAIRYYAQGLRWARSPYGFHTLGSAMAVNTEAYCQARGFPKRAGGEDFYLLNKLAKLGPVYDAGHICVGIDSRRSLRVPFGTGPAVHKILTITSQEYLSYQPTNFLRLKQWLAEIPRIWSAQQAGRSGLEGLPEDILGALHHLNVPRILQHLQRQIKDELSATKALHDWFDAFKTLKFIHYLQDNYYSPLPLRDCLKLAPFRVATGHDDHD